MKPKVNFLHKEGLMGRDGPEGSLAEEQGYHHWTRREPCTEPVTREGPGYMAGKSLGSRVTIYYAEKSPHLFRLTRGSA